MHISNGRTPGFQRTPKHVCGVVGLGGFHISGKVFPKTRYTSVEREELLYPKSTMVAEVGGTLGLFLGISFMTIWDGAVRMKEYFGFFKSFLPDSTT